MIRKTNVIIFILLLIMITPLQALASGLSNSYYPPSDSDYYQKKISDNLYIDNQTYKVRFIQYTYGLPQDPENVISTITWNVKPNSFLWVDYTCKGAVAIDYLDLEDNVLAFHQRGQTDSYLNSGTCSGETVKLSDYNEDEQKYKSDTFGATMPVSTTPTTADGSGGGTNTSPYYGDGSEPHPDDPNNTTDPGTGGGGIDPGTGDGGTDPGTGESGCIGCEMFNCPGWSDYMGKLDEIKSSIPPAPNWSEVAGTFRDTIVPKLVSDMETMLGSAPTQPTPPSQLTGTDDRGINTKVPVMSDVPGLKESGFSSDKIKTDSQVIEFREDPTGGFNLLQNPLDSLPILPGDSFPKPGATDPGEWGQNKPLEPENPFPFPQDTGEPVTEGAPTPTDSGATPPSPGTDTGTAPIPGEDTGAAPTPTEDPYPGMKDYKPSPDSADGSGGDI